MHLSSRTPAWLTLLLYLPVLGAADEPPPGSLLSITIAPEWQPIDAQHAAKTVNAYSGAELDAAGIEDSFNLQYRAPGLVFKTNAVLGQPYIRGVGSDITSAGAEASVASFVDGIYLPRAYGSVLNFYDLERVEVIKGPQAVHLGRNVVGGAISVHTRNPEPYRSAYADLTVGSYDKRQLRGAVNLPLDGAKLAVRLAGAASVRDGYTDDIFLGTNVDDEDYAALRGKLLYAPTAEFSLLASAEHHDENDSRGLAPHPDADDGVSGAIQLGGIVPDDPRQVTSNVDIGMELRSDRYSARLAWRRAALEIVSTTALIDSETDFRLDLDNTNLDYSANFATTQSATVTQEFRLTLQPQDSPWSHVTGLYFLREDAAQRLDVSLPLAGVHRIPDGAVDTRSYALFGQSAYRFAPAWRAKAGVRYSHDRRSLNLSDTLIDPLGIVGVAGTTVGQQNDSGDWDAVTPELGIDYAPGADRLYFATVSRGYKAGGFNTNAIQSAFDPEFLLAYETGVKSTLLDRRLRINAALFQYDYDDMQLDTPPAGTAVGTAPVIVNAAKATINGADLELLLEPLRRLVVSLEATTLFTAQFDAFTSVDLNNPTADPDRAGAQLPQAPEASLAARADYNWPLAQGTLSLAGQYRYQSQIYFNVYQDPAVRQSGYGLFDASLEYADRGGDWYAQLYGRNLTDELYTQNMYRADPLVGILRFWGPPRTLGVRIGYRW